MYIIEKNITTQEIQIAPKENWEKPELTELDINKTENGLLPGTEGPLNLLLHS